MNSDALKRSSPERRKSLGTSSFASNKSGGGESSPWRSVSSFGSSTGINARFPEPPPGRRSTINQMSNPIMNRPLKPATKSGTKPKFRSSINQQSDEFSWLTDQSFSSMDSSPERSVSSVISGKSSPERKKSQSFTSQTSFSSQVNENDEAYKTSLATTYTDNHIAKSSGQVNEITTSSPSSYTSGTNAGVNTTTASKSSKKRDPAYTNPDNWTANIHTGYNREFYYNDKLQITQWNKPKCLLTEEDKHSRKNWEVHGDGKDVWYVNTITLKSQYEKPSCIVNEERSIVNKERYSFYLKFYTLSIGFGLFISAIFPSTTHFLFMYFIWFIKLFFKQIGVILL